uniref:Uncharacterized protein n=1 Tax=viral metagenome TaxID=1070528 RepID=A0A6C0ACG9_9ZZZZ
MANKYSITHPYGFEYPMCPFVWDYEDMALPLDTINIKEMTNEELNEILQHKPDIKEIIKKLNNPKLFMIEQIIKNKNLLYLGFHNWCYFNETGEKEIFIKKPYFFIFNAGLFTVKGKLDESHYYPFKINKKGDTLPGGIPVNKSLEERFATIHKVSGIPRYSPEHCNNFIIPTDMKEVEFISIGKDFSKSIIKHNKNKEKKDQEKLIIKNIARDVVTLHRLIR